MKHTTPLLLCIFCCLTVLNAAEPPTKKVRGNERYTAVTLTPVTQDASSWFIPNEQGSYELGADTAAEVIAHYHTKPASWTKDGIFVVSYTHSIPLSDKEKKIMSAHILKLVQHQPWRDAENKLVDELVAAANKEGIPVWINVTNDMGGLFTVKLLTDPTLTLKKQK